MTAVQKTKSLSGSHVTTHISWKAFLKLTILEYTFKEKIIQHFKERGQNFDQGVKKFGQGIKELSGDKNLRRRYKKCKKLNR